MQNWWKQFMFDVGIMGGLFVMGVMIAPPVFYVFRMWWNWWLP